MLATVTVAKDTSFTFFNYSTRTTLIFLSGLYVILKKIFLVEQEASSLT